MFIVLIDNDFPMHKYLVQYIRETFEIAKEDEEFVNLILNISLFIIFVCLQYLLIISLLALELIGILLIVMSMFIYLFLDKETLKKIINQLISNSNSTDELTIENSKQTDDITAKIAGELTQMQADELTQMQELPYKRERIIIQAI